MATTKSTVALLGTLRELHTSLQGYGFQTLQELASSKSPDFLCLEIDRADWEAGDLDRAPVESAHSLVPASQAEDIVVMPIGSGGRSWEESGIPPPRQGLAAALRARMFRWLDAVILGLMKLAGGPRAVNSPTVEHICNVLCGAQAMLADPDARRAWTERNQVLLDGVLWTVRRDPGRRILVAVDCRRKHWLQQELRSAPDVTLVDFWSF